MNDKETPASEPDWWAEQDRDEQWIAEQMKRISAASPLRSGAGDMTQPTNNSTEKAA